MTLAVDWGRGVSDAWSNVAAFVPKLVAFLVILLIGWLVAKALERILDKVLERVGFDRWVERGGIKRALASSRYDASSILGRLVFYAVLLFTLSVAFGVFGSNPISDYLRAVIAYLPKIFIAIVILVIAAALGAGAKALVQNALGGLPYGRLLANLASAVIIVIGVFAALNVLAIATAVVNAVLYAGLAAIAGIAIVAIGGGGVRPMQERWERVLTRYDVEKPRISQAARQAPSVRQQAEAAYQEARPESADVARPGLAGASASDGPAGAGYDGPGYERPSYDGPAYDGPGDGPVPPARPGYGAPEYGAPEYGGPAAPPPPPAPGYGAPGMPPGYGGSPRPGFEDEPTRQYPAPPAGDYPPPRPPEDNRRG